MARRPKKSTEERALRQVIRASTTRRDWSMVEATFNRLGQLFEEQEARA